MNLLRLFSRKPSHGSTSSLLDPNLNLKTKVLKNPHEAVSDLLLVTFLVGESLCHSSKQ